METRISKTVRYTPVLPVKSGDTNPQLRRRMEQIERYEWFDNKNRVGALQAFESSEIAAQNGFSSQVELYQKDTVAFYNKDRADKCVAVGRKLKLKTRTFAVHDFEDGIEPFEVKSTKWDWTVYPLDMSSQRVPPVFLERRNLLSMHGINFDSFAIAVPSKPNYMPASQVVKTETRNTIKSLARIGANLGNLSYKGVKAMAPVAEAARRTFRAVLKDPVLLGCYGKTPMFLVEIGRWE